MEPPIPPTALSSVCIRPDRENMELPFDDGDDLVAGGGGGRGGCCVAGGGGGRGLRGGSGGGRGLRGGGLQLRKDEELERDDWWKMLGVMHLFDCIAPLVPSG